MLTLDYLDIKSMDETELLNYVIHKVLRDNPNLERGEDLTGPACLAQNGKLLSEKEANGMENIDKKYVIEAKTILISIKDFIDEKTVWKFPEDEAKWIHFYALIRPLYINEMVLDKEIEYLDPKTFKPYKVTVTQDMIDQQKVFIRYGVQ